jgi:para-aminobenzoate synthetase component 1
MIGKIDIPIGNLNILTNQLCRAMAKENYGLVLNSNGYVFNNPVSDSLRKYDLLAAIGAKRIISPSSNFFDSFKESVNLSNTWLFGFLGYDLKNDIEKLSSSNTDYSDFPQMLFFEPEWVFAVEKGRLTIHFDPSLHSKQMAGTMYDQIMKAPRIHTTVANAPKLKPRTAQDDYLKTVEKVIAHIQRGDIYEMNLCQEFFSENVDFNPIESYIRLNEISPTPFSAFGKFNQNYVLCASPERYLCKRGTKVVSQPIKGTGPRGSTPFEDMLFRQSLLNNQKERAENIMIVDLVRNDLSRIAAKGSVTVDELCGVYPFRQVNQLISTVSCELNNQFCGVDAIRASFPMGSMTGAPKIRAMELIDRYENFQRGLFSGSIGYFDPSGDFDFNVVIRSLLYNKRKKYLSLSVGGAITIGSNPMDEYQECMLKAQAAMQLLQNKI